MTVTIRRFEKEDISRKVEWINNPENNRFLHYALPLEEEKTREWFERNRGRTDRYDAVMVADGIPCGVIGLLNVDQENGTAEYYVAMGETRCKRKGISTEASRLILEYGFFELGLNRIYLFTETENLPAQGLFEKVGFVREGCLRENAISHGRRVDRYVYGLCRCDYRR